MKNNYSIIMADDDPDDHYFFQEALKKININCNLTSVYDGQELINFLLKREQYVNNDLPNPDLVILDLNMPVMNGFDTLQRMGSNVNLKNIPVYVMSTSNDGIHMDRAMELGAKGFYIKPDKHSKLQQMIVEILITQ